MNIELLAQNPELAKNVTLSITASDLQAYSKKLVQTTADEVTARIQAENKPPVLLTRDEVAKKLGVTKTTLWHWANKDILKPVRIGGKVRYREIDVMNAVK